MDYGIQKCDTKCPKWPNNRLPTPIMCYITLTNKNETHKRIRYDYEQFCLKRRNRLNYHICANCFPIPVNSFSRNMINLVLACECAGTLHRQHEGN